jgi:hypothetical protein
MGTMTLDINSMRYNISVLKKRVVRGEYGSESIEYDTIYNNLKAGIKTITGSKGVDNEEIFTSQNIIFTTHYRDIKVDNLILYEGNKYRIVAPPIDIGYKAGLEISCELINE